MRLPLITWHIGLSLFIAAPTMAIAKTKSSRSSGKQQVSKANVRKMFAAGLALFKARKFNQALIVFDRTLRQFPNHQPTIQLFAKALYRLDRIPESYQMFSKLNLNSLDIETSYEYALSHFWMRQYQPALAGFQRIPEGNALFDLANYYGGIAALKLTRLLEAETMIEKAVVLPLKLAKSRKNYLKHIQALKLLYEKKGLALDRQKEKKRIEAAIKKERAVRLSSKETKKAVKDYKHQGFEAVDNRAELGINFKNQLIDRHGFSEETNTIRTTYFQFLGGPLISLPYKTGSDQAALGLQITGRAEEQLVEGKEQRNVQSDDLEDIRRIETTKETRELTKYGSFILRPWIEFPTPIRAWLSMGGSINFIYPDFERKDRTGTRSGYLRVGSKVPGKKFAAKYQYGEVLNSDSKKITAVNTFLFIWNFEFTEYLGLDVSLKHDFFVYDDLAIDGPASATSFSTDLWDEIPFGFTIGAKLSGQYQSEFFIHDLPDHGEVSANGQTYTGKAYLLAEPIEWFSAEISQQVQKTTWIVTPSEAEEPFQRYQPDWQQTFVGQVSLNLLF